MYSTIQQYCGELTAAFNTIPPERRQRLQTIADYILGRRKQNKPALLIYICTHNSRRSHFGQVWAKAACAYYSIGDVEAFSGGTEATAFNGNAIKALERAGFRIKPAGTGKNPHYLVAYDDQQKPLECFSKVYDDNANPRTEFAAIMTCGEAEENCPFVAGAQLKIATTYEDPKAFDGTARQDAVYDERCRQIALETLYVFSLIHNYL